MTGGATNTDRPENKRIRAHCSTERERYQMNKRKYIVFRVREYDDGVGHISRIREKVGETFAVSPAKARANDEFRIHGKSVYDGSFLFDTGADSSLEIYYEAEEA